MKDYTELLREIRMIMRETKIGYWKILFAICLVGAIWRAEVIFKALGWIN